MNKQYLTVREAAEYANVSRSTIDGWIRNGILKTLEYPSKTGETTYKKFRRIPIEALHAVMGVTDKPKRREIRLKEAV